MRWLRSFTLVTCLSKLPGFTHLPPSSTPKEWELGQYVKVEGCSGIT